MNGGAPAARGRPAVSRRDLPEDLETSAGFLLSKAAELAAFGFEQALRPYGIKPRGYGVLRLIDQTGPLPQRRIGEKLRIDRTTMVAVIDSLEERGLVMRVRDPADRRRYAVTLSGQGRRLLHGELIEAERRAHGEFLRRLSPAERDCLVTMLAALVQPGDGGPAA